MPERLTKIRKKRTNSWVTTRKIVQAFSFVCFVLAVVFSKNPSLPIRFSTALVQLSPLAMLSGLLSSKTFLTGSTLALVVFLSSFVVGRGWCGWLCPLGTLLDIFHFSKNHKSFSLPEKLRGLKYGLLIIILISAIFGNLTLLFLDPLTIFVRSATLTILPVIDRTLYFLEKSLIKVSWLQEPVFKFDAWLRPSILPTDPLPYKYALLFAFFFILLLLLNLLAERFWCRYLCPLGALLGLPSKVALFKRQVQSSCTKCGLCEKKCPTATIDPENGYQSDPSECILCMDCLAQCGNQSTIISAKWQPVRRKTYDPDRRSFLSSLGISVLMLALFQTNWIKKHPGTFLLRPPGVNDNDKFLSTCVRCDICIQTCPTQALQIDLLVSGFEGAGTPIFIPRSGACSYSCNICGQKCPVNAIPPLPLDVKRTVKIGNAYIDKNRCIAWADHNTCLVCEEMCPLPQKAITLENASIRLADGKVVEVGQPVVNRDLCIGCGICENKCPLSGDAAIRIHAL